MNAVYDRDIKLSLVHPDLWMKERTMLMKMGGAINGAPGNMQQGKNQSRADGSVIIMWGMYSTSRLSSVDLTFYNTPFRISRFNLLESLVQQILPLLRGVEPQQRAQQPLHRQTTAQ